MGFGVPLAAWFRGSLREMLWDHLTGPRIGARDIVSAGFVHQLLTEHDTGRRDNSHWLWSLLVLELWLEELEQDLSGSQAGPFLEPLSVERFSAGRQ